MVMQYTVSVYIYKKKKIAENLVWLLFSTYVRPCIILKDVFDPFMVIALCMV
jgi:hypothetical protein